MAEIHYLLPIGCLFLSFVPTCIGIMSSVSNISTDKNALLGFQDHITSDIYQVLSRNWSVRSSACEWIGVTCDSRNGRVTALNVSHMGLFGAVAPQLGNLSFLVSLDITGNKFHGEFPYGLSLLPRLRILKMDMNSLSGKIPSWLGSFHQLQFLSLSKNNFTGSIPSSISKLSRLEELYLGDNKLEGEIPQEIGNLSLLTILSIHSNRLSGVIPREFGNLYNLEELYLHNNILSGSVPIETFNLSTTRMLSLQINKLSGNLPSNICQGLSNLENLYLYWNELHGTLPESISNCSKLKEIRMSGNDFVGSIPKSLGNLRLLELLYLAENHLTSFSASPQHSFITSLTNCKYLRILEVQNNPLNGHLPDSVGNLSTKLERFHAYNCSIKGQIPHGFGNLSSLIELKLQENQLTGSVPTTVKELKQLQSLNLSHNGLNRAMLDQFCGLRRLGALSLGENQILESIPECLGNITSLRYLELYSNGLTSTIPANLFNLRDILMLNLSRNSLSGSLPPQVGNLKVASLLDLSVNNLSSGIPSTIGALESLNHLSLAFNRFQGWIPESMGKMISLETLDLSHNDLSGMIPMTLEKLQYLKHFNVSFNGLSGKIPSHGPFKNLTSESFIFNKALCGAQRFRVPPCPKTSTPRKRGKRVHKIFVILLGLTTVACSLTLVFACIGCLRKYRIPVPIVIDSPLAAAPERFTYDELAYATNGFDESNLLGKGSFGSVYRGVIDCGRIVAIKVFNLEVQSAFKSFNRECEVLSNLRHRNLTKVITNCSTPDFKALVLEFMPNGTLEKWLYSPNCLNIMQRLDIMIDVAFALEYLHNEYLTPVVHCDLKPSNILLDQDMVAHVSDFGISKFLDKEDSITYTQTIATFGYVAPEYGFEGVISPKCDVYSYGILMMEIFTRTKPSNEMFDGNLNLRSWVSDSMPNGLAQVIDPNILSADEVYFNQNMECVNSIMEVALNCTKQSPRERGSIKDVLAALQKTKLQLLTFHHREV